MKNEKTITFKGEISRRIYSSDDYKVYSVKINCNEYPEISVSEDYGTATICGDIQELDLGATYIITASKGNGKYGVNYTVKNIIRQKPTTLNDMYVFLQEILTFNQASVLYEAYPDIVDKIINNDTKDIDFKRLKGITELNFEGIKKRIIQNFCLAELVTEFGGYLSLSMIRKLYEKYPSTERIKEKLEENPYKCLCGLARVGFLTADKIILELDKVSKKNIKNGKEPIINFGFDLETSEQRCLACIMYLLSENENDGHTYIPLLDLKKECEKMVLNCSHHFIKCIKDKNIHLETKALKCALKTTYETEKYICKKIQNGLDQNRKWEYETSKYRDYGYAELSDEQMLILEKLCKNNICILNGFAGSGKSFTTKAIIQMLKDNNKTFKLFSPTGKAAKVLAEYTKEITSTIHRGLGYMPPDEWTYNEENPMMCDVLIIDEFSMTDIFLFKKVLKAIDFSRTKLLLVGDNAQLPSVSCGNLLHDLIISEIVPTVTLTKIFRYDEGGLMKVATDTRNCEIYLPKELETFTYFGENKDYAFVNLDSSVIVKNVVALYKKMLEKGYGIEDIQILTAYKKGDFGTFVINKQIQKVANKNYGTSETITVSETKYYVGDLVIQTANNYKALLFKNNDYSDESKDEEKVFIANGEVGIIKAITSKFVIIEFGNLLVKYTKSDMQGVALGYCITIHKSQGSSSKVVILVTPKAHTYMLNSNLIYVGLTRMKEKCFHIGNAKTVNNAVLKKANLTRNTFLQDLLKE